MQVLLFAVLGGIGSVLGPIIGAVGLTALPEAARWASDYREVLYGAILMLVVVFRPQGLVARRRRSDGTVLDGHDYGAGLASPLLELTTK